MTEWKNEAEARNHIKELVAENYHQYIEAIKDALGFIPEVSFAEGTQKTAHWLKEEL